MHARFKTHAALGKRLWFTALWLQFFFIICITMPFNRGFAHRLIECAMLASIGLCCVKIFLVDTLSVKALGFSAAVLAVCAVSALVSKQRLFLGLIALVMSCRGNIFPADCPALRSVQHWLHHPDFAALCLGLSASKHHRDSLYDRIFENLVQ